MKERFRTIYKEQQWNTSDSDAGTVSGPGSSKKYTANLVSELPQLIQKYNINSILDAPSGDFNWMPLVLAQVPQVHYQGGDIVPELIEQLKQQHPEYTWWEMDVTTTPLPTVDLMMCRDCLMHLSLTDIRKFRQNFLDSGSRYLLTTHHAEPNNSDIESGGYRHISMYHAPFNMQPNSELERIRDYIHPYAERYMLLFSREQISQSQG
mgnify:CR=1 FL=1